MSEEYFKASAPQPWFSTPSDTPYRHPVKYTIQFSTTHEYFYTPNTAFTCHCNHPVYKFPLHEMHKYRFFKFAVKFSLIMPAPSSHKPIFFQALLLGCRRFQNVIDCAKRKDISERSAQKQQHQRVCHCSHSFVVNFVLLGVNDFATTESEGIFIHFSPSFTD